LQKRFGGFDLRKFLLFFYTGNDFTIPADFALVVPSLMKVGASLVKVGASPVQLLNHGQAGRQEPRPFLLVKK
jgi:hypothetical protein